MNSIRRNLLLALLGSLCGVMLLGAWATYDAVRDEANAIFDYHLKQIALSVRDQSFEWPAKSLVGDDSLEYVIRVWGSTGLTVYSSRPHQTLPELTRLGYADADTSEGQWRIFAVQFRGQTIAVAQPMRVRKRLAAEAAWRTLNPFLVLLPVMGLLIWIVVGRGLQPLARLTKAVSERTPYSLEPLREQGFPEETKPLLVALNDLLVRLKLARDAQRDFVADVAHELRTPLTALQLQVQLVERSTSTEEFNTTLAELKNGLERTTHTVQQLLMLARQEPGAAEYTLVSIPLSDFVQAVVLDQVSLAEAKGIDLGVTQRDEKACVLGDAVALRVLLSNLLSNALRYTPEGGRVDVASGREGERAWLEVSDNGPGIPAVERERVFDRFYRRAVSAGDESGGSGLGLAIVRSIADRHNAKISLGDAASGGLKVRVDFPLV